MAGTERTRARNERRKKNRQAAAILGGGKAARAAARKNALQATRAALGSLYSSELIGSGSYNLRKSGTNSSQKKKGAKKVVDIGGRSLSALKQANCGDYLGAMMSGMKILGKGDYQLSRNTIVQDITSSQVPVMHSAKESIRFRHREFVTDVFSTGSVSFNATVYTVNPGLADAFPYLSSIAQQFQEYRFMGLAFEFKSTSAVAMASGTNISMGTISMAAQYRATAATFLNKQQMMNEMWAVDGRPCDTFMLPIECAPHESPLDCLYVRGGAVPSGEDLKLYDLCKLTLATAGIPGSTQPLGELWVTYDVELFKPALTGSLELFGACTEFTANGGVGNMFSTPVILTDNIGFNANPSSALLNINGPVGYFNFPASTSFVVPIVGTNSSSSVSITPDSITFPVGCIGTYQILIEVGISIGNPGFYASGVDAFGNTCSGCYNSVAAQNNWKVLRSFSSPSSGQSSAVCLLVITFQIPNSSAPAVLTFANISWPSGSQAFVSITQISAAFL